MPQGDFSTSRLGAFVRLSTRRSTMYKRIAITLIAALFIAACDNPPKNSAPVAVPAKPAAAPLPARKDFAAKLARIKEQMPAAEALAILGKPDDIRTQEDPGGIDLTHTKEIWSYGSDRHLGFATLGTIAI